MLQENNAGRRRHGTIISNDSDTEHSIRESEYYVIC
jgi:hypothetical protein